LFSLGEANNGLLVERTADIQRLAHVDLRADPEEIEPLVSGMRMFAGYAEWGPGQLEEEIEAGEWFVSPALAQDVITPGPADLWADVM
ncbi:YqgE/AlgH family protein, partial [Variovorax sp. CT11-76]